MKTLTTEKQTELITLFENLSDATFEVDYDTINLWLQELKPKRVRRKKNVEEMT